MTRVAGHVYEDPRTARSLESLAEQILPHARIFAETYGIPVELLRVNDPDIRTPFWHAAFSGGEYLQRIAGALPRSLRVDCVEESGKPAAVIVERAKSDPACIIAMATHGLSGARRWLLGSVASRVAHTTTNPLLIHPWPAEAGEKATRIELKIVFVPLDGSGLAEKILPHVITLAKRRTKLEVHLVRVYTLPADAYIVGNGVYMQALTQQKGR